MAFCPCQATVSLRIQNLFVIPPGPSTACNSDLPGPLKVWLASLEQPIGDQADLPNSTSFTPGELNASRPS